MAETFDTINIKIFGKTNIGGMKMKSKVKQITMLGLLVVFLSVIAVPLLGAPIAGKIEDKKQMNFVWAGSSIECDRRRL